MWRPFLRLVLGLLLILSFAGTLRSGLLIYESPAFSLLVDETQERIEARIERLAAREFTQEKLDAKLTEMLGSEDRNWLAIDAVVQAAAQRGVYPSPEIEQWRQYLYDRDSGFFKGMGKCAACMWDAKNCKFSRILICRAPVDLTPLGDVAGVVRETGNYFLGRDVDMFDLTLSSIGLGAEALILASGGSSATIKGGSVLLKTGRKMGIISPRLARAIIRIGSRAIDWKLLRNSSVRSFISDLKRAIRPKALRPLTQFIEDAQAIRKSTGSTVDTLYLMRTVDNFEDGHKLSRASKAIKKRSVGYMEMIGKSRIFRATMRYADEAVAFVAWIAGLVASLLLFVQHMAGTFLIKRLRRVLRKRGKQQNIRA